MFFNTGCWNNQVETEKELLADGIPLSSFVDPQRGESTSAFC
jgi:hypothetical protein